MGLDQYVRIYDQYGECIHQYTYRKENWLRQWVIENTKLTYDSNCEEVGISHNQLQELEETIDYVLNHKEEAKNELPCLLGFFFGSDDYDEWYFNGLKNVKNDIREILNDDEVKKITYEDWW